MSDRRRHVLRFSACLVAGMLINIAIAWMLAISVDVYRVTPGGGMTLFNDETHWSTSAYRRLGSLVAHSTWRYRLNAGQTGTNPADFVPVWMPNRDPPEALKRGDLHESQRTIDARGWPMLSLWSSARRLTVDGERQVVESANVEGGIEMGVSPWITVPPRGNRPALTRPRVLPLRPVWPGFAVNSIGFGLVLWLAIFGWRDARAFWRARHDRCCACGYPVGESERCSECGVVVRGVPITPDRVR